MLTPRTEQRKQRRYRSFIGNTNTSWSSWNRESSSSNLDSWKTLTARPGWLVPAWCHVNTQAVATSTTIGYWSGMSKETNPKYAYCSEIATKLLRHQQRSWCCQKANRRLESCKTTTTEGSSLCHRGDHLQGRNSWCPTLTKWLHDNTPHSLASL